MMTFPVSDSGDYGTKVIIVVLNDDDDLTQNDMYEIEEDGGRAVYLNRKDAHELGAELMSLESEEPTTSDI